MSSLRRNVTMARGVLSTTRARPARRRRINEMEHSWAFSVTSPASGQVAELVPEVSIQDPWAAMGNVPLASGALHCGPKPFRYIYFWCRAHTRRVYCVAGTPSIECRALPTGQSREAPRIYSTDIAPGMNTQGVRVQPTRRTLVVQSLC